MAINVTRLTARTEKTRAAYLKIRGEIAYQDRLRSEIETDIEKLLNEIETHEASLTACANTGAAELISGLQYAIGKAKSTLAVVRTKQSDLLRSRPTLLIEQLRLGGMLEKQDAALAKKAAAYPGKLRRHQRRMACNKEA